MIEINHGFMIALRRRNESQSIDVRVRDAVKLELAATTAYTSHRIKHEETTAVSMSAIPDIHKASSMSSSVHNTFCFTSLQPNGGKEASTSQTSL
jgi:hypothetical protein